MKHCYLIFSLALIFGNINAQYWAPDGAKWHVGLLESGLSPPSYGYLEIEVIGDTIIQNHSCKILHKMHHFASGYIYDEGNDYMYGDSGKVYHYLYNVFYKLYDFNLVPGDSWTIINSYGFGDSLIQIMVDSISSISLNGNILRTQFVHSINSYWIFRNPIIENIGSGSGFYPFAYAMLDADIPYLRCYEDKAIFYQYSSTIACDSLISITESILIKNFIDVFPNPVDEELHIENGDNKIMMAELYDMCGRKLISEAFEGSVILHLNTLPKGMYLCKLISHQGEYVIRKINRL